jgi:hypothetical protein
MPSKNAYDSWQDTKDEFQKLTGQNTPKPKSFLPRAFNHTGMTSALKAVDKAVDDIDDKKKQKLATYPDFLKKADAAAKTLHTTVASYLKLVEKEALDEVGDDGEKSQLYRGLKYLKAQVNAIVARTDNSINACRVANDKQLSQTQRFAALLRTALKSACAAGTAATKRIKAEPTAEVYNSYFKVNDSPGRKLGASLKNAIKQTKDGNVPALRIDPADIEKHCADYGTENSKRGQIDDNATPQQVLAWTKDFEQIVKAAVAYADELPG